MNDMITIALTDEDGNETKQQVAVNATLADVIPAGRLAILNGQSVSRDLGDVQLRANDHVEVVRKSGKAA